MALNNIRRKVGESVWIALYQQRPRPQSGNWFKAQWFTKDKEGRQFWTLEDAVTQPIREAYLAWDTAAKTKEHNDLTAGGLSLLSANSYQYILPVFLERREVPDVERIILTEGAKWWLLLSAIAPGAFKGCHIEEGASGGTTIVQNARRLLPYRAQVAEAYRLHLSEGRPEHEFDFRPPIGWEDYPKNWKLVVKAAPIILLPHPPDRVETATKAKEILSYCESQSVRLVEEAQLAPYARGWLGQLLALPLGAHDDAVDVTVKLCRPYAGILETKNGSVPWTDADVQNAILPPL
jgi:phage terminase large subunit-like protein